MTEQLVFDFSSHPTHITTYRATHDQVRKIWGKASQYRCVNPSNSPECKRYAAQWAYDRTDPTELKQLEEERPGRAAQMFVFSVWPEFYMPLCRPCHKRLDLAELGRPIKLGRRGNGRSQEVPPKTVADWERWYAEQGKPLRKDDDDHDIRMLWMVMREQC